MILVFPSFQLNDKATTTSSGGRKPDSTILYYVDLLKLYSSDFPRVLQHSVAWFGANFRWRIASFFIKQQLRHSGTQCAKDSLFVQKSLRREASLNLGWFWRYLASEYHRTYFWNLNHGCYWWLAVLAHSVLLVFTTQSKSSIDIFTFIMHLHIKQFRICWKNHLLSGFQNSLL